MKIYLPFILFLFLATFSSEEIKAQDPIFSQFYASPLQTNPALTGVFNGRFRVSMNYKQQWNSILDTNPFKTISAGVDVRHRVGRGDFVSYGITALRDEAGQSQFTRNMGAINASYMKQLDGGRYRTYDQYLIAGLQVGVGQFSIDGNDLWFSSQFDLNSELINTALDPDVLAIVNQTSDAIIDINAGLMWYSVFDDNKSLYLGGAIFHANGPKASFIDIDGQETIDMRWMGQFGGELPLSRQLSVLPAVIVTGQGPSLLSIFGMNFRYTNRDWKEVAIRAGAWGHISKDELSGVSLPTVTFTSILEIDRWNIGISYDVNSNKLATPTNSRGGFELSLIYVHPASRKEKVNCPKM